MSNPTCETCRWWDTDNWSGEELGYCRKAAPTAWLREIADESLDTRRDTVWPVVSRTDWCGEHQPKEA